MNSRDHKEQLAGEYVLGTLDSQERSNVDQQRLTDSELENAILDWEQRLIPLVENVDELAPPALIRESLEQRLDGITATNSSRTKPSEIPPTANVVFLKRRLQGWRWAAGLSSAACLLLAALLWLGPKPIEERQFVAVFQQNDQQPAFLLSVDLDEQLVHIRPVTAKPIAGKSYQLWIKADSLGPQPRSVAVLDQALSVNPTVLRQYDPELLKQATFGISIEPEGGSPTGQPTTPAIHGFLYPPAQAM